MLGVMLLGAEVAARLDDWLRHDVPVLANPERQRDLVVAESWGYHGRPYGRFRKWKLNAFGFRGPDMLLEPEPNRTRLLILGASETFGLYESADKEYPAQLGLLLGDGYEVINAAMAGISLGSMLPYWENWASKFHGQRVLLYSSPMFYLDEEPPAPKDPRVTCPESSKGVEFRFRLAGRIADTYHTLPEWIKRWREQWVIRRQCAGKGNEWLFTKVPEDRLDLFHHDLRKLVLAIRRQGAQPILVTHASSVASPLRVEDDTFIRRMRMFFPRALPETLIAFEDRANDLIRELASSEGLQLIDVDRVLSGNDTLFADMVHFNDAGAARMAGLLAQALRASSGYARASSPRASLRALGVTTAEE
jgi:lysophospholipase L1-like esterase